MVTGDAGRCCCRGWLRVASSGAEGELRAPVLAVILVGRSRACAGATSLVGTVEDMLEHDDLREVRMRAEVARILGTPQQRRRWRRSLGYSLRDASRVTGLSVHAIRRRETSAWRYSRGSLLSPQGLAYLTMISEAQGLDWHKQLEQISDRTTAEGSSRASPRAAA
jgi:hypothetical protein